MKKTIITVFALLIAFGLTAQEGFYQTIEKNGKDAKYVGFFGIAPKGDGTYEVTSKENPITLSVNYTASGTPTGFTAIDTETNEERFSMDELSDYERLDSYPYATYIRHKQNSEGFMLIDDILLCFRKLYNDGSFKLDYIFVKEANGESQGGKKKKKKGFFSKLKAAYSFGPEHKKLTALNLDKVYSDYISAMKAKQSAYTLTAKDKAAIAEIKSIRDGENERIKKYNDSIYNSPAYRKARETRRLLEENAFVKVKNMLGRDIWVGGSGTNSILHKVSAGSVIKDMSCDENLYYRLSNSGSATPYSFYTANSNCGGMVTIK
ncbi:hypothetical protein [Flavivirga spongiicola]|uniref:DUF4369 domain-containing protein n=1 Tax=Flavivirga spongiicola TaxID=421621 RepID=A0ABU7XVW9_9FLAO|nr:hypothetical protein [Flavivirga sp. MEBiC05379]MDO5979902.1 hypothetical protein [Flavivirga sp. MEBiC05379]